MAGNSTTSNTETGGPLRDPWRAPPSVAALGLGQTGGQAARGPRTAAARPLAREPVPTSFPLCIPAKML